MKKIIITISIVLIFLQSCMEKVKTSLPIDVIVYQKENYKDSFSYTEIKSVRKFMLHNEFGWFNLDSTEIEILKNIKSGDSIIAKKGNIYPRSIKLCNLSVESASSDFIISTKDGYNIKLSQNDFYYIANSNLSTIWMYLKEIGLSMWFMHIFLVLIYGIFYTALLISPKLKEKKVLQWIITTTLSFSILFVVTCYYVYFSALIFGLLFSILFPITTYLVNLLGSNEKK